MRILSMDTSNQAITVGLMEDRQVRATYTSTVKKNHSLTLMPAIAKLMAEVNWTPQQLDRIVVAQGPGSYTGLRIAVTTAKTLAYTLQKELVGVSSLAVIAANCEEVPALIVPLFNARRNYVYTGAYQKINGEWQAVLTDRYIALAEWLERLQTYPKVYFVGTDVAMFEEAIFAALPQAIVNQVVQWQLPQAEVLAMLGARQSPVEDWHTFVPQYLKRVEAEENWLKTHASQEARYVERL